jgi:ribosomal protein L24E
MDANNCQRMFANGRMPTDGYQWTGENGYQRMDANGCQRMYANGRMPTDINVLIQTIATDVCKWTDVNGLKSIATI